MRPAWVVVAAAGIAAGLVIEQTAAEQSRPRRSYDSGQEVVPAYEGWEQNPDGSFSLVFGTMNRNWEESLHIPIGPDNNVEPGGPDQGQPTWFLPRRNRFMFRIRVPADFGEKELVWTLTRHGITKKAYGTLKPDYFMDNNVMMANNGAGISGELYNNIAPELKLDGKLKRTAKVNQPVTLTAVARDDDGLPKPRAMRPTNLARPASLTPNSATGLRLSWFVFRGPQGVTFDPTQIKAWEDTRANSNSPWGAGWETPPPPVVLLYATSRGPPSAPPAVCALISSVLVSSGPPRPSPPSGGRSRSRSIGRLRKRSPLPSGVIQECSPRFMSIAVMREYGGFHSGSPCGITGPPAPSRQRQM